ncbi:BON domain-containing protein [Shinella yambaruensis]|uniref:BON domain-containing protein n=1 Tax=Shinella yambaruensis TaxID=415996 RepID=A0ABQ5ZDY7_9HYPH|nr:BON domain-containing protein [Shinella yambaruensis]MCJ8030153.1 BON domain-containing protein [Shinella yambaruensis]MCU7984451.1 BON domain-containing protein [Shinella yambaruensis]GLR49835.1 hypothetical protein GCM10007923_10400 [Shinella yambaruensis]
MNDSTLRQDILDELNFEPSIDAADIGVAVENGIITLSGRVDWQYQRIAAADAVRDLAGVVGVTNKIEIEHHVSALDVKKRIEDALKRNAEVEAQAIKVAVLDGGKVRLDGWVHAWSERRAAEQAAWAAAGVHAVEDHISVG